MKLSREGIVSLLEERIKFYSGGEELKSLAETVGDEKLVEELKAIKSAADGLFPTDRRIFRPEGFQHSLEKVLNE